MNRRHFLKKTTQATLVTTALPFILPSGRLFAATGDPKVEYVVFCLFAGGIRNWESIDFKDGNLMPNMLEGDAAISADIAPGIQSVPRILDKPLQHRGTLMKNFRYKSEITLHYNAHVAAVTGQYAKAVELMKPIHTPSIFEYFRKHSPYGRSAMDSWWVSDQGGPFPYLQYSSHSLYGSKFAGNMIEPNTLFSYNFAPALDETAQKHLSELTAMFARQQPTAAQAKNFTKLNSDEDTERLRAFIHRLYNDHFKNGTHCWDDLDNRLVNDDMVNVFTATEILKEFHPRLMVVNMQDSDIGHSNFTEYVNNMHKADYALAKLWKTIQDDPLMRDNTVLVAVPEFGRNKTNNSIIDKYGRYAVDHTGDEVSQQIFCMIAGPKGVVRQDQVITEEYGETIDIVPTIAHLMGFDKMIPQDLLPGKILYDALV